MVDVGEVKDATSDHKNISRRGKPEEFPFLFFKAGRRCLFEITYLNG
jgi:hypothetical protein